MSAKKYGKNVLRGVCLIIVFCSASLAAEIPVLKQGGRVRATVRQDTGGGTWTVTGTLLNLDETSLTIAPSNGGLKVLILRDEIYGLESSMKPGGRGKGALIGLGVGAVMGAMVGYAGGDDPEGMLSFSAGAKAGVGAVVFGAVGALVGALASSGEQWESIPNKNVQLGFYPGVAGETGFCIAGRF
jgi:hypothetical protein